MLRYMELMASYGVDRNSLIINLGGGVVTDLGGRYHQLIKEVLNL